MTPTQRIALGSLLTALLVAGPASAADYCLDISGVQFVAKKFKLPGKGKCKPFAGFCSTCGAQVNSLSGSACTAADGSHARFNVTLVTQTIGSTTETLFMNADLPAGTVTGNGILLVGGQTPFAFGVVGTAGKCPAAVLVP